MDWCQPIDIYCERHGPGFWGEPLNAWSNAAFWIAAALTVPALRRAGRRLGGRPAGGWELALLTGLLLGIGAGSFLFHTFAVSWAGTVDVGMIVLWIAWFLWVYGRRVLRRPGWAVALGIIAMFTASVLATRLTESFLGSYAPVLAVLAGLGVAAWRADRPAHQLLLIAAGVFTLSMTAAALDGPLCPVLPTGTHFIWHLLNATTLALCTFALAHQTRPGDPHAAPPPESSS
ncbi:MAG: hypothetical protein AAGG38_13185 [Planctomycetota bacterium]